MSQIADTLIKAYKMLIDENDRAGSRELHSLIRRRFPDQSTLKKLRDVRRTPNTTPTASVLKEIIPRFKKKTITTSKREEVAVGKPKKTSNEDLSIERLLELLHEGEEAVVVQFGSVMAFKKYTEDRFEGLDYGRKSAFGSLGATFLEYIEEESPEEEEEVVDIFD
jgi:hypothetical protein